MVTITRNYNDYNMFCRQSTNLTFMHNFIGWYQIKCVVAIRIDDHWHLMPTKIHHHNTKHMKNWASLTHHSQHHVCNILLLNNSNFVHTFRNNWIAKCINHRLHTSYCHSTALHSYARLCINAQRSSLKATEWGCL